MDVFSLITEARDRGGSDLHLVVDSPPLVRVKGALDPLKLPGLSVEDTAEALNQLASPSDRDIFHRELELDFGFTMPGVGRLRCNAAQQRGAISLAIRLLPPVIPTIDELELPQICKDLVTKPRGLVVVTGPTGSGKSTTLAAMIQHLNNSEAKHVITIEDPIEYVYPSIRCAITQRQLGTDTKSFAHALKHVLRQNPDVILVGEMRDLETAAAVLTIAETGHLVLSTSHAPSTHQALERIIDLFPPHERHLAYTRLASLLVGVLCQALVPRYCDEGRIAAVEVMLANTAMRNLIREEKLYQLPNVLRTCREEGMMSLDDSLVDLYRNQKISRETVFDYCADQAEVERLLGGRTKGVAPRRKPSTGGGMISSFL
ncbi:type IV pilus twitching motility protein PilT [Dehalogenimonas etheniformans]|uniref:Type IV pili twitching motility protein PilT n=1 Tax=Dehalogenimonas etheniformans TaxID=1536648 RepID=A0A2P5P9V6_9CHLR|nr:type IV pili twitching motility protein PilT [Dehalogenimonas etheniformans]QNT77156.1 PilT/PilU family type 4a pilus ATPase [Dehalogenimonas etheniformans]